MHGLEVDDANEFAKTVFPCPLSAGDVVLHLPTTLHYAGLNTTPRQRRTYIVAMIASSEPRAIPVDSYWMREKRTARQEPARCCRIAGFTMLLAESRPKAVVHSASEPEKQVFGLPASSNLALIAQCPVSNANLRHATRDCAIWRDTLVGRRLAACDSATRALP